MSETWPPGRGSSHEPSVIACAALSQTEVRIAQEREAQIGLCTDAAEAVVRCRGGFVDRVGAEVGEFVGLQVAPHRLDGVQVVAAPALRASLDEADAIPHAGSSAALERECRRSSSSPV